MHRGRGTPAKPGIPALLARLARDARARRVANDAWGFDSANREPIFGTVRTMLRGEARP
ncbi:hypothetical protein GCM10010520_42820 [Rhizobium viscosum]